MSTSIRRSLSSTSAAVAENFTIGVTATSCGSYTYTPLSLIVWDMVFYHPTRQGLVCSFQVAEFSASGSGS